MRRNIYFQIVKYCLLKKKKYKNYQTASDEKYFIFSAKIRKNCQIENL